MTTLVLSRDTISTSKPKASYEYLNCLETFAKYFLLIKDYIITVLAGLNVTTKLAHLKGTGESDFCNIEDRRKRTKANGKEKNLYRSKVIVWILNVRFGLYFKIL